MRQKTERHQDAANRTVKDVRRKTRKRYAAGEKIRIALAGLRGEDSIAELGRQESISQDIDYAWLKEFLEAGTKRLAFSPPNVSSGNEPLILRPPRVSCTSQASGDLPLRRSAVQACLRRIAWSG